MLWKLPGNDALDYVDFGREKNSSLPKKVRKKIETLETEGVLEA